jgi:hypothetical protein
MSNNPQLPSSSSTRGEQHAACARGGVHLDRHTGCGPESDEQWQRFVTDDTVASMSAAASWVPKPRLLDALSYPPTKTELLERAAVLAVPGSVRDAIVRLPARTFGSRSDFVEAIEGIASR